MKPLVAIGIPVYNGDEFLEECLNSILNQTFKNWDCVIVNNKSTDKTFSIAESFVKKDNRFRLVTNDEFVDITTNFNNAYKYSNPAKYFKVVCADDWLFPEYLDRMVDLLEAYPQAGLCSSYRLDNTKVNCSGLNFYEGPIYNGQEVLKKQLLYEIDDVLGSETTILMRSDTLKKVEGYPTIYSYSSYHFDTSLAYELLYKSDLAFVFQVLSYTRRNDQTYTSQYSNKYHTHLNLRELEVYKYMKLSKKLEKVYKNERERYAYLLFRSRLRRDKECLQWHHQRINPERSFTLKEEVLSFIRVNFKKIFRKGEA